MGRRLSDPNLRGRGARCVGTRAKVEIAWACFVVIAVNACNHWESGGTPSDSGLNPLSGGSGGRSPQELGGQAGVSSEGGESGDAHGGSTDGTAITGAAGSGGRQRPPGNATGGTSAGGHGGGTNAGAGAGGTLSPPDPPLNAPLAVTFSPSGGGFLYAQQVTLEVPGEAAAIIHYTLDGSIPSANSPVYAAPILVDESTQVKAIAVPVAPNQDEAASTRVFSSVYLRLSPEAADFSSHLPIIAIDLLGAGELDRLGTEFVPATFSVFEPEMTTGRATMLGAATLQTRIGIHVRGQTSRGAPKVQYAVEFRNEIDDEDMELPLLGMPKGSDWVLSDPVVTDRSLIRNSLVYELSNRIGRYAPRTRFAEGFVVTNGTEVGMGNFVGLYTAIEKIKRDKNRVDVAKLSEHDLTEPQVTGGYVVRIDKGAPDLTVQDIALQFVYPKADLMLSPDRMEQFDYVASFIDDFRLATKASNFRHPVTAAHYSSFIDVDAWIDFHIINAFVKNVDGLIFSTYLHKHRGGPLVAGPVWDFDRCLGTVHDPNDPSPEGWFSAYLTFGWWHELFRDPAFKARYKERFLHLLATDLAYSEIEPLIDSLVEALGDAPERNFARWPETPPLDGSHEAEITLIKDFIWARSAWLRDELSAW